MKKNSINYESIAWKQVCKISVLSIICTKDEPKEGTRTNLFPWDKRFLSLTRLSTKIFTLGKSKPDCTSNEVGKQYFDKICFVKYSNSSVWLVESSKWIACAAHIMPNATASPCR